MLETTTRQLRNNILRSAVVSERATTITQSLSTDTRFMIAASFSTHAMKIKAASNPTRSSSEGLSTLLSIKKITHEAATTSRCETTQVRVVRHEGF